ncbi:MAG: hypothetical protein R6U46_04955 [Marinilabilia sp.]
MSKHYCGDDLISVELSKESEPCCDDGMCCNTESGFFQLDEDFVATASHIGPENGFIFDLLFSTTGLDIPSFKGIDRDSSLTFSNLPPPRRKKTDLALRQVYRL